jgi:DNA-binding transcriptional LysR family regulator
VRIRVLDESEQNIVEHVRRGEAEIAVDMRTDQPDDDLVMTTVMEDRFVLACRRDHPLANGRAVPWPELVDMPVVMLGQRSGTSRLVYTQLPRSRNAAAWRYEVQHLSTALSFIEAGLGVAVIPVMAMQALGEGALVYRPLVEPEVSRTIVVVERRDATLSPAAETLKALLIEEFRAWTAGDAAIPQRAVR